MGIAPIPMTFSPGKDVDDFAPGEWQWLGAYRESPLDGESIRVGFIYRNPVGALAVCLSDTASAEGLGGARWAIVGDESTGLTVTPSIMHKRGEPDEWHGYITDGQLITLDV